MLLSEMVLFSIDIFSGLSNSDAITANPLLLLEKMLLTISTIELMANVSTVFDTILWVNLQSRMIMCESCEVLLNSTIFKPTRDCK